MRNSQRPDRPFTDPPVIVRDKTVRTAPKGAVAGVAAMRKSVGPASSTLPPAESATATRDPHRGSRRAGTSGWPSSSDTSRGNVGRSVSAVLSASSSLDRSLAHTALRRPPASESHPDKRKSTQTAPAKKRIKPNAKNAIKQIVSPVAASVPHDAIVPPGSNNGVRATPASGRSEPSGISTAGPATTASLSTLALAKAAVIAKKTGKISVTRKSRSAKQTHASKQKAVHFETTSAAHEHREPNGTTGPQADVVIVIKNEDGEAAVQTTTAQPAFPPGLRPYEALLRKAGISDFRALKAILPLNKVDDWVSWLAGLRTRPSSAAVATRLRLFLHVWRSHRKTRSNESVPKHSRTWRASSCLSGRSRIA